MPRGTQLSQLRDMTKAEIGFSQTVGTAVDLEIDTLLSNKQKWLGSKWNWPFLETRYPVAVGPGARYVNVPNMNFERPVLVEVKWSTIWQDVDYGIGSQEFNYLDSDVGSQQDPVLRWTFAGELVIPPPTTAVTLATSGNGSPPGTASYAVTYVTPFGETTVSPATAITFNNIANIILTNIPIAPSGVIEGVAYPDVTMRKIYRTKLANPTGPLFLLFSIADNTTTTINDPGTQDQFLGVQAPLYSNAESTVMEIWPLPASAQQMQFTGQRLLNSLVADTDTADLDDMLLVLFVAAEMLRRRKMQDADLKLSMANSQLAAVRSNYPRRTRDVNLGGRRDGEYNKITPFRVIAVH